MVVLDAPRIDGQQGRARISGLHVACHNHQRLGFKRAGHHIHITAKPDILGKIGFRRRAIHIIRPQQGAHNRGRQIYGRSCVLQPQQTHINHHTTPVPHLKSADRAVASARRRAGHQHAQLRAHHRAVQRDGHIFVSGFRGGQGHRHWRSGQTGVDVIDDRVFPRQAVQLPKTKPDKNDHAAQA